MCDFNEDVFCGASQGPVIRRDYKNHIYSVNFSNVPKSWFQDNREIIHPKYKTIKEANIGFLHELLDEFITEINK